MFLLHMMIQMMMKEGYEIQLKFIYHKEEVVVFAVVLIPVYMMQKS